MECIDKIKQLNPEKATDIYFNFNKLRINNFLIILGKQILKIKIKDASCAFKYTLSIIRFEHHRNLTKVFAKNTTGALNFLKAKLLDLVIIKTTNMCLVSVKCPPTSF